MVVLPERGLFPTDSYCLILTGLTEAADMVGSRLAGLASGPADLAAGYFDANAPRGEVRWVSRA